MFTASYSILRMWENNERQRAIKSYFKLEDITSPAMARGKEKHQQWAEYISKHQEFPKELGGRKLQAPQVERRITMPLTPEIELTGIIDCYDQEAVYDFKTGKTLSSDYIATQQIPIYGLLLASTGISIFRGAYIHLDNQGELDTSYVIMTDKTLESAGRWAYEVASDIDQAFKKEKLYEQYQHIRDRAKATTNS